MMNMSLSKRLFRRTKSQDKRVQADVTEKAPSTSLSSSISSDTASDTTETNEVLIHYHANILSEKNLDKLWKNLKGGVYNSLKGVKLSFNTPPARELSKMKHLGDVFGAVGNLKHLEDVEFCNATLFLPSVHKLLKNSSLRTLKFHNCKFILLANKNKKDKDPSQVIDNFWEGIQQQTNLAVLEILACSYSDYQTLTASGGESQDFSYPVPLFLQEHKLPNLQRLVLDKCILDSPQQSSFVQLLSGNTSLEELEIQPVFETAASRRQQYQAKKRAVRRFLVETIPTTLKATNNSKLSKLVVSIDDYHLESVYVDALAHWVDLVQDENRVLTVMRATPEPLSSTTKEADNLYGLKKDGWLHCHLQYYLRLNELKVAPQDLDKKEFVVEMLPEAYDVSCLHELLQPNPDIMDAMTQSMTGMDSNVDKFRLASTRRCDSMRGSSMH